MRQVPGGYWRLSGEQDRVPEVYLRITFSFIGFKGCWLVFLVLGVPSSAGAYSKYPIGFFRCTFYSLRDEKPLAKGRSKLKQAASCAATAVSGCLSARIGGDFGDSGLLLNVEGLADIGLSVSRGLKRT
jgi:hypothetical protein